MQTVRATTSGTAAVSAADEAGGVETGEDVSKEEEAATSVEKEAES